MAAAAAMALVAVAACGPAPDESGDPAPSGAAIDEAVVTAAGEAGLEACPDDVPRGPFARLELTCLAGGRSVSLGSFTGTPVVLNAWASWCEPCREELPLLARAAQEYEGRVQVVGVLFADADPLAAVDLARESGVTYPQLADPGSVSREALRMRALPQTVFLDADGRLVATEHTAFTSYGQVIAAIEKHLGVSPS